MIITIPGELPSLNEIIDESKKHYHAYNKIKTANTDKVTWVAKGNKTIGKANYIITWYCKDRKKDKDNIMAGQKFIFDGLVHAGVIANDNWKYIGDITHRFEVDKVNPRIEITIEEVEDNG